MTDTRKIVDSICKCRRGSMDDKQFRAKVEFAIQEELAKAVAKEKIKTKKIVDDVKDSLWKIQRMGVIDFKGEKLEVITRYQALNTINLSGLPYTSRSGRKLTNYFES